jgi:hypothetical protein
VSFLHCRLARNGVGIGDSKGVAPVHTSVLVGFRSLSVPVSFSFSLSVSSLSVPSTIGNDGLRISIILLWWIGCPRKRMVCGLYGRWLGLHEMRITSREAGQICAGLRLRLRLRRPLLRILWMLGIVLIRIRLHDDGRQEQKRRCRQGVAYSTSGDQPWPKLQRVGCLRRLGSRRPATCCEQISNLAHITCNSQSRSKRTQQNSSDVRWTSLMRPPVHSRA